MHIIKKLKNDSLVSCGDKNTKAKVRSFFLQPTEEKLRMTRLQSIVK